MNYYYDVVLNFLDTNVLFYEWNKEDNLEYFKKIPLIKVSSKTLRDFINNDVCINQELLKTIKDRAIFADKNGCIALEFNASGKSIARSFLSLSDELNIGEIVYTISTTDIDYKIENKINYNKNLREEDKIKLIIKTEIKVLNEVKDIFKLKYLYMEWFNECSEDITKMVKKMNDALKEKIGRREVKIYDLIKLSYNKV